MNHAGDNLQKIARTDEPVFFIKRRWVFEYWDHIVRDPQMPKRDSPDEWVAAVDRGELVVLGARVLFIEDLT